MKKLLLPSWKLFGLEESLDLKLRYIWSLVCKISTRQVTWNRYQKGLIFRSFQISNLKYLFFKSLFEYYFFDRRDNVSLTIYVLYEAWFGRFPNIFQMLKKRISMHCRPLISSWMFSSCKDNSLSCCVCFLYRC